MHGLEGHIDRLFDLPLDEFTASRNELAKRLRAEQEGDAAAEVRALPKPSVPAWAINQVSRREPDLVQGLLAAGEALRKAQRRLVERGGSVESVRNATSKQREAVGLLTDRARDVLEEAGRAATPATIERVRRTLEAAAVDEEGRRLLKAGRLTTELEPVGFDALASLQAVPAGRPALDELAERRRRRDEAKARKREAQQRVRELEQAARDAEREADRAGRAVDEARRVAERTRAAANAAAAELADLE